MSFTARVKDELSRLDGRCDACSYAELSAIVRVCGTLTLSGRARHSIRVSTETGAVARTMIRLTHELFDLETPLTVRRSNLHKARNYLIEIPEQDKLAAALVRLGIVTPDAGLVGGVSTHREGGLKVEELMGEPDHGAGHGPRLGGDADGGARW
uniref:DNA-binding protein WhiA n=1 Tax=Olsenella massiliensis TaxID=1622075 RepID=UPI000A88D3E0